MSDHGSDHRDTVIAARARQFAATAGWFALLLPFGAVLLSPALSPASNGVVRAALAAFMILAIFSPGVAFLVTTALVGFGIILSHLAGVPDLRVTELLVVASIAGCGIRALFRDERLRQALADSITVPVVVFAIAVITSSAVWLRVQQFETGEAWPFVNSLVRFLGRDYFIQPGDFWNVVSAAVILEGLSLYVVCAALCRSDRTFFHRATRMLAVGGAGLGAMSILRLGEIALRNPGAVEGLRSAGALRISPQIPDYIAAGSYFALCALAAIGLAWAGRRWLGWLATAAPIVAALYLTGSRSVIGALMAGIAVLVILAARRGAVPFRAGLALVALTALLVVSFPWLTGRDVAGDLARQSLTIRAELIRTGLRVMATRPLFGVGIDRFYLAAGTHATPELHALWPGRKNPHNDFLRFGAELGAVGVGLFLWILAAAASRVWRVLSTIDDRALAGVAAGLVAFLVTSLVSNPLMVREVSYVFWIALGLVVGRSASLPAAGGLDNLPVAPARGQERIRKLQWSVGFVLGGVLMLSVPYRARQEIGTVDISRVTYGLFDWNVEPDGARARWSGPRATFFVDRRARLVEIPLSSTLPSGDDQHVEIRVDGQPVDRIAVGPEWRRLRTLIPPGNATGPRRIDLLVTPSWVPADVFGNSDRREIGARIGEIKVLLHPDPGR